MIKKISFEDFKNLIIDFLNEHNILESFEENLFKHQDLSLYEYIYEFYKEYSSMEYFILTSFGWSRTKEGLYFWEKINDKYIEFLANIEKEFWYD